MEEIGFNELNNEVQKTSKYYNNTIVGLEK